MAALTADARRMRAGLGQFARIYLAAGLILAGVVLYLMQAAHVTETSYRIQRLRSEQADLLSQQEQLRYREASLQAPARLQQAASLEGFKRVQPARYLTYAQLPFDLGSRGGDVAVTHTNGLSDVVAALTGSRDAAAAGR